MKRREFLQRGIAAALLMSVPLPIPFGYHPGFAISEGTLLDHERKTLSLLLDHLFPSSADSPGASDINAAEYIERLLTDPALTNADQAFLRNGIHWLDEHSITKTKKRFAILAAEKRIEVIKSFQDTERGENWLSNVLRYLFESLFGDPVYGGNKNEVGWKWIEHPPGFPRPKDRLSFDRLRIQRL